SLAVLAARVDRDGPSDLGHPPRLMDVTVKAQTRAVALDRLADRRATDRNRLDSHHPHGRLERLVELGAVVEARCERRDVQAEDRTLRILELADEPLDLVRELLLGPVARAVPRRVIRVAEREQLGSVGHSDDPAVRRDDRVAL